MSRAMRLAAVCRSVRHGGEQSQVSRQRVGALLFCIQKEKGPSPEVKGEGRQLTLQLMDAEAASRKPKSYLYRGKRIQAILKSEGPREMCRGPRSGLGGTKAERYLGERNQCSICALYA